MYSVHILQSYSLTLSQSLAMHISSLGDIILMHIIYN